MENNCYFAVFGDIHGRIALMYTLAKLWQTYNNHTLSGLLEVGDMGAFPDISKLDSATFRHAKEDKDELGFSQFIKITEESTCYFGNQSVPRTYFIRGNHEDFDYLAQFREPCPVDPWKNIWFIPDGNHIELYCKDNHFVLASFGGIPPRIENKIRGRRNRYLYRQNAKSTKEDPRLFISHNPMKFFHALAKVDILMTHAGPFCDMFIEGSEILAELDKSLQPRVHLFGHHHCTIGPLIGPGNCLLVGLEHLEFKNDKTLREGSWGILKINAETANFEFVNEENNPWLKDIQQDTYREMWQSYAHLTPEDS